MSSMVAITRKSSSPRSSNKKLAAWPPSAYILPMSRISTYQTSLPSNGSHVSEEPAMDAAELAAFTASVKQGLAELDSGRYVSGEEMDAWAKSLFTPAELPLPPVRQRARS